MGGICLSISLTVIDINAPVFACLKKKLKMHLPTNTIPMHQPDTATAALIGKRRVSGHIISGFLADQILGTFYFGTLQNFKLSTKSTAGTLLESPNLALHSNHQKKYIWITLSVTFVLNELQWKKRHVKTSILHVARMVFARLR